MTAQRRGTIVVDGSNVAYEEQSPDGKPRLEDIELALAALRRQYDQVIVIVDATLHHEIDRPQDLEELLDAQTVRQAPAGTPADYFVLQTAEQLNADVLSNDTFRQYHDRWPWIEHRRIPFMVIKDRFIVYRPAQVESDRERARAQTP